MDLTRAVRLVPMLRIVDTVVAELPGPRRHPDAERLGKALQRLPGQAQRFEAGIADCDRHPGVGRGRPVLRKNPRTASAGARNARPAPSLVHAARARECRNTAPAGAGERAPGSRGTRGPAPEWKPLLPAASLTGIAASPTLSSSSSRALPTFRAVGSPPRSDSDC